MKIDKSTALFLSKILFHYEQIVNTTCADADLVDRVRQLRGQFNDEVLSVDVNDDIDEDEDEEEEEGYVSYDYEIYHDELVNLTPLAIKFDNSKLCFKQSKKDKNAICLHDHNVFSPKHSLLHKNVRYIKRTGKELLLLTKDCQKGILFGEDAANDYSYWETYQVSKFPFDWIDALTCGKVYKCV